MLVVVPLTSVKLLIVPSKVSLKTVVAVWACAPKPPNSRSPVPNRHVSHFGDDGTRSDELYCSWSIFLCTRQKSKVDEYGVKKEMNEKATG